MRISVGVFAILLTTATSAAFAVGVSDDFSTNPLTDPNVIVQGPDAANVASRFTYNAADGTLTAHYNTASPTIKLLFPLGQTLTQNDSFHFQARVEIVGSTFNSPAAFSAQMPSFGLVNSATTGSVRASTIDAAFNEVTQGNAYDMVTFDYFPTTDPTFGGNSVDLTVLNSQQSGVSFDSSFGTFAFANSTFPVDQFVNVTVDYSAITHQALLQWGSESLDADLSAADFSVDSFAINLWNDPNPDAQSPAVPSGDFFSGDVIFDSISASVVPEPTSLALFGIGAIALLRRRR